MESEAPSDFVWLTSPEAAPFLQRAQEAFLQKVNPVKLAKELRKSISPAQSALVMEQAQLRLHARKKFSNASALFFTGRSLEQSSGQDIAKYKAEKFIGCNRVADICCGIGGDLLQLAARGSGEANGDGDKKLTVGLDRDPIAALFATQNISARSLKNTEVVSAAFEDFDLSTFDGVHIDPDRRVKDRTVVGNAFHPKMSTIFGKVDPSRQTIAIKVAPASQIKSPGSHPFELEWIGDQRECKQQIVWMGPDFQRHQHRSATVVQRDGSSFRMNADAEDLESVLPAAPSIEEYIYEPHATILAAEMIDFVCAKFAVHRIANKVAYLVSRKPLENVAPLLKGYKIEKVMSVDLRTMAKELKAREIGTLVVKKRGIEQVIADRFARLKLAGPNTATVLLTRHGRLRRALLATPMDYEQ